MQKKEMQCIVFINLYIKIIFVFQLAFLRKHHLAFMAVFFNEIPKQYGQTC